MPAWTHHRSYWEDSDYRGYRNYVRSQAPGLRGNTSMDCADLSMMLLIRFASQHGLPLCFTDMSDVRYDSRLVGQVPEGGLFRNKTWSNVDSYLDAVTSRIGTEALWHRNTQVNPLGPEPGDLLMKFRGTIHHTALVFRIWLEGEAHPRLGDRSIADFPRDEPGRDADEIAISQPNTEYFRDRNPNAGVHFDYLNHRSNRKAAGAELIYFARVAPLVEDGYQFRRWSLSVLTSMRVPEISVPGNVG